MCPKPERFRITPSYLVRLALLNLGAAVAAAVVMAWVGRTLAARDIFNAFLMAMVYSFSIGGPAGVLLPQVGHLLYGRSTRLKLLAIGVTILILTFIGCFVAALVLVGAGLYQRDQFWTNFWNSLRLSSIMAITVGCVAFAYEDLRDKLHEATLELRTRQLEQERAQKLVAEAQLSSLESRIHPHFLFNTLNSIAGLIQEDPGRAEEIVGRLAALLRFSLDSTRHSTVPLAQEIKIVRDYLEIEKARFGSRLRYSIEVPAALESVAVPPLALQTLVENSVKYAIAPLREGGEVNVNAAAIPEGIELSVSDTGQGFDIARVPSGHGIDNLVGRLAHLYNGAARFETASVNARPAVRLVLPR